MVDDLDSIKGSPALTFEKLSEIALGMLTSSSIERYTRVMEAAAGSLVNATSDIIDYTAILHRALTLWGYALESKERLGDLEPELAVMVYVLYKHVDKASYDFMRAMVTVPTASTRWIIGMLNYLKTVRN